MTAMTTISTPRVTAGDGYSLFSPCARVMGI